MIWSASSARPTWLGIFLKTSSATWSRRSRRRPPTAEPPDQFPAAHSSVRIHGYPCWGSHGHPHGGTKTSALISSVDGSSETKGGRREHRRTQPPPHHP